MEKNQELYSYLGFIQNVITRMGQNSFQAKAWCITIASALTAIMFGSGKSIPCVVGIFASVLFCLLDSYYLYLEREYRQLYNIAAGLADNQSCKPFDMAIPREYRGFKKYCKAVFSITTGLFYTAIIVGMSLILIFA